MPKRHKILLIDNDAVTLDLLKGSFTSEGFSVETASNGVDGIRRAEEWAPDLVILDLMMPGMDGFEVCRMLKSRPVTANIPILMLTARVEEIDKVKGLRLGADDYVTKPYSFAELLARVRTRLRHAVQNRNRADQWCEISITYDSEHTLSFRVEGALTYSGDSRRIELDLAELNQELADMGDRITAFQKLAVATISPKQRDEYSEKRDVWRRQARKKGSELYKDFIGSNTELVTHLELARNQVGSEHLLIRFMGPRAHLGMPWELLHDGKHTPLVIMHPTCRTITGIEARSKPRAWDDFLEGPEAKPLRVLLLAANDGTPLTEIKQLSQAFKKELGDQVIVEPDPLAVLSRQEAEALLGTKSFHLIHYAGHSQFDAPRPDRSGLRFGSDVSDEITASRLYHLLRDSAAHFVFLNSCVGAQVANADRLKENDYLGLLDTAIVAGVPAALGFRWDVSNRAAMEFAQVFYNHLFETRSLEEATWQTRCDIYGSPENGWNETWLSPILIVQNL
jgi:DNA-binding response OmpR family regulator